MCGKSFLAFILLTASSAWTARAAVVLPDACGKNEVKFDIRAEKSSPIAASPGEHNAQIVFVETLHKPSNVLVKPTVRFGVDGAWVGAAKADSYFTVSVVPGEHHLCAASQSHLKSFSKDVGLTALTAQPGKTYFVEFKVNLIPTDQGASAVTSFSKIDGDEGRFHLKTYPLAAWTTSQ